MWIHAFEKRSKSLIVRPPEHPITMSTTRAPMSLCAWYLHFKLKWLLLLILKYYVHDPALLPVLLVAVLKHINGILSFRCQSSSFSWKQQLPVLHQFHLSTYMYMVAHVIKEAFDVGSPTGPLTIHWDGKIQSALTDSELWACRLTCLPW